MFDIIVGLDTGEHINLNGVTKSYVDNLLEEFASEEGITWINDDKHTETLCIACRHITFVKVVTARYAQ